MNQKVQKDNDQSTPHVLTKGKVMEQVNKIQLGPDLCPKERRQYEDLLRKYIHLFAFSYKDFREIIMEQHKIKLLPKAKPMRTNVATLALSSRPRQRELQGCGPKGSPGVKPKGSLGVKAKALQELRQEEARESHNILPGV